MAWDRTMNKQTILEDLWKMMVVYFVYAPEYSGEQLLIDEKLFKKKAEEILNSLEDGPKWISVEDKLPEKDGRYLIRYKSGKVKRTFVGDWYVLNNEWGSIRNAEVTHWMPLPAPPQE